MLFQKSSIPSPNPAPQPTYFCFLALAFPCNESYDLHKTKCLSCYWYLIGHPLLHMQQETQLWEVLVSSYCCSSYRVADHFSSLGTFSSSFIRGSVFHPIDNCEHPLLYLPDIGIDSQEKALSGSFQQILQAYAIMAAFGAWVWDMDPQVRQSLDGPSFHLSSKLCLCNSFHWYFIPYSREVWSIHELIFLLDFLVF